MPKEPADDDIPFSSQDGDSTLGVPSTPDIMIGDNLAAKPVHPEYHRGRMHELLESEKASSSPSKIHLLEDKIKHLQEELDEAQIAKKLAQRNSQPVTMAQRCFLALLQGQASAGEFARGGKLQSDDQVMAAVRHLAGVASYAASAANAAKL